MEINLSRAASDAGTSSYTLMYSQQIVDHFMKTLEENGCMIQFPMGLYIEFDNYENQLGEYIQAALDAEDSNPNSTQTWPGEQDSNTTPTLTDEIIRQALKSVNDKCFNCKIEKPKFDFSNMFGNLLADIQASLEQFKNLFKYKKASVCQYAFFLSYLCVPDLLKLLAMILAAIVRLLQRINLPRITIALFIQGILSAIIQALVKNISILARFALTPVLCILDAIEQIIDALPTPENIRREAGHDLEKLGLSEYVKGNTGLKEGVQNVRDAYVSRVRSLEKSGHDSVQAFGRDVFGPIENTITKSVESLNDSINELLGLLTHYQCEPGRSGISISEFLSAASELMALANLIRYIIRFKSGKAALDKLCNAPANGSGYGNDNQFDDILNVENIGSIIAGVISSDIDIITDENNDPIGIVIKDDTYRENPENLSFWNCNLKDFTNSINIPNIVRDTIKDNVDKVNVTIDDFKLNDWTVNIIPRERYNDTANTPIIPLVIDEVWSIPNHVKQVIETFELYNPSTDGNIITEIEFLPEDLIEELLEKTGITNPLRKVPRLENVNPKDNIFGSNIPTYNLDPEKLSEQPTYTKTTQEVIIGGNRVDGLATSEVKIGGQSTINLECDTPEGILSKLGDI